MRGTEALRRRLKSLYAEQTRPRCGVVEQSADGSLCWNNGDNFNPAQAGAVIVLPAIMEAAEWERMARAQQAALVEGRA